MAAGAAALAASLFVTTAYHLGYADFRSPKIVQPNIGSAIGLVPTLASATPWHRRSATSCCTLRP